MTTGPLSVPADAEKEELRRRFSKIRNEISDHRRTNAEAEGEKALLALFDGSRLVLSYHSFGSEFNTNGFNAFLAFREKLVLPKTENGSLVLYRVRDLASELEKGAFGIFEPKPALCEVADPGSISLALVPGLAFDLFRHRIGYGKGFYDRFLRDFPFSINTIGIGFKEQLHPKPLPAGPADVPLSKVLLF